MVKSKHTNYGSLLLGRFKIGDRVKNRNGSDFSNGMKVVTVTSSEVVKGFNDTRVWLLETKTHTPEDDLELVEAAMPVAKSSGGSNDYYKLPDGATELGDLIEAKNMNFNVGNIFKAAYRLGAKPGVGEMYDLEKIVWFATREINRIRKTDV